ncbi:putative disease resistance protein RGA3 [Morus notabilis]|uniref:putative disease resistance protein RGA3 n=1 Tax=Morus notabilis TaxID=981085 RepID=UPI000CED41ED|nr:putative disease resistance protein RGA3 [Morus notabilis]
MAVKDWLIKLKDVAYDEMTLVSNHLGLECNQILTCVDLKSLEEMKTEKIIRFLMNPIDPRDVAVIPIVGMGGLGKTTVSKLVYNDKRVEEHFERRIWVCVSEMFDVKKLMRAIVESATGIRCDLDEMEAIHRRVQELIMGKRFLLVLDDVRNEDHEKWDRLKNSVQHGSEGSGILVTTRSEKQLLVIVSATSIQKWKTRRARFKFGGCWKRNCKCKGVPLAAKALGSSLPMKRQIEYWITVRDSEMWSFTEEENVILQVLRLSYDSLPSHLKQCFAYCSLYPKDYKIKKENLIHLWIAEGFVRPSRGKQL